MHQVSQPALVGQLAPAPRELVGRGAHVVLVGFHLCGEPVIVGQRQHVAVDVGQLPAAQELQPELEPVGQLVLAGLLHVLNGDRLQAGADVLGGLLCAREAGPAELQVLITPLGRLRNAAARLLLRHSDVALVPERRTPSIRGVVGQDALGHAQHLRQRSVVARAQAQQVAHRLNEIRPHRARAIRNRLQVGLRLAIRQCPRQHLVVAAEGVVCALAHVLLELGQRCLAGVCGVEALADVLGNRIGHGHQVTRMLAGHGVRGLRAIEHHAGRGGMNQLMQQDLFFRADLAGHVRAVEPHHDVAALRIESGLRVAARIHHAGGGRVAAVDNLQVEHHAGFLQALQLLQHLLRNGRFRAVLRSREELRRFDQRFALDGGLHALRFLCGGVAD